MWMNFKNIMLSARSCTQKKYILYISILYEILEQAELIHNEKSEQWLGVRGEFTVKAQEETF